MKEKELTAKQTLEFLDFVHMVALNHTREISPLHWRYCVENKLERKMKRCNVSGCQPMKKRKGEFRCLDWQVEQCCFSIVQQNIKLTKGKMSADNLSFSKETNLSDVASSENFCMEKMMPYQQDELKFH